MKPIQNAANCLRRGRCDPVGGVSVTTSFDKLTPESQDVIMAIAQSDSSAIFHTHATGADSSVSGTVSLLAALHAMRPVVEVEDRRQGATPPRPIVFAWITGDSMGLA